MHCCCVKQSQLHVQVAPLLTPDCRPRDAAGDIVDTVKWLQAHDDKARRIARAGKRFASLHLHRQARLCYYRELFEEMSKLYK